MVAKHVVTNAGFIVFGESLSGLSMHGKQNGVPEDVSLAASEWSTVTGYAVYPIWSFSPLVKIAKGIILRATQATGAPSELSELHAWACMTAALVSSYLGEFQGRSLSPNTWKSLTLPRRDVHPMGVVMSRRRVRRKTRVLPVFRSGDFAKVAGKLVKAVQV